VLQRIAALALSLAPATLAAQTDPGAALWRLATQTLAQPPALVTAGTALFWNPAQALDARAAVALDAISGAEQTGASGVLGAARVRAGRLGSFALVAGRMQLDDIVPTSTSPVPDAGAIPFYTQLFGASWARRFGTTTVGATAAWRDTQLDDHGAVRATVDVGVDVPVGRALRLAAATHAVSSLAADAPDQDLFAGAELVVWRGQPWTGAPTAALRLRYGTALAHGFGADHQLGAGFALGDAATIDVLAAHEGGWAGGGWLPVAAVSVAAGPYRLQFAANGGAEGLGTAVRVGLEARFR
jgi:hypothetical protein